MKRINDLAMQQPLIFGFFMTFIFILMVLFSSITANAKWLGGTSGWYIGSMFARLVSIIILLFILSRLGWLHSAGFTRLGQPRAWLSLLLLLVLSILVSTYAMTGNLEFGFSDPILTSLAALFLLAHAFLEEVTFRGLLLHGLVRAWGNDNRGLIKSVLASSLFFGGYHILYLAGESLSVVLPRIIFSILLGIVLGVFVLRGKSIYPAALFHGVLNLAGYLNLTINGVEGSAPAWLWMSMYMLPLALYGLYLLRSLSLPFMQLNEPMMEIKYGRKIR